MAITVKKATPKPAPKPVPKPVPVQLAAQAEEFPTVQIGKTPIGTISKQYADGTTVEKKMDLTEQFGDPLIAEPHATVGVSMGLTRATQPYENIKCQVSLFIPCAVNPDDINETYTNAKEWVSDRINEFNEEVNTSLGVQQ